MTLGLYSALETRLSKKQLTATRLLAISTLIALSIAAALGLVTLLIVVFVRG